MKDFKSAVVVGGTTLDVKDESVKSIK